MPKRRNQKSKRAHRKISYSSATTKNNSIEVSTVDAWCLLSFERKRSNYIESRRFSASSHSSLIFALCFIAFPFAELVTPRKNVLSPSRRQQRWQRSLRWQRWWKGSFWRQRRWRWRRKRRRSTPHRMQCCNELQQARCFGPVEASWPFSLQGDHKDCKICSTGEWSWGKGEGPRHGQVCYGVYCSGHQCLRGPHIQEEVFCIGEAVEDPQKVYQRSASRWPIFCTWCKLCQSNVILNLIIDWPVF